MASPSTPPRIAAAPDPLTPELEPLLDEPFASAWAAPGAAPAPAPARGRLLDRIAASKSASAGMFTTRSGRVRAQPLVPGVSMRSLYAAPGDRVPRPGEPLQAWLVELQRGASWAGPGPEVHREWLVLRGRVRLGGEALAARDYHVAPAGSPAAELVCDEAALVFLRCSVLPDGAPGAAFTVRDADADWPDFAPGIQRRVLWQHGGQAALMYRTAPGATVPLHAHGHDEECLMVQGELFLDDTLLQAGDYQLAPAGSRHHITETDTGAVIYAHGDLDLQFVDGEAVT